MGMIMDVIKSFSDMKKLASLEGAIEEEIKKLEADGKLPAELKTAFEALKNSKSTEGGSVEDSLEPLKKFVEELEKYESLFPENIKSIVDKFEGVEKDLEGVAENVDKLTKK